jgi:ribonuclease D
MAVHPPKNVDELKRVRGLGEDVAKSKHGAAILEAVKRGLDAPRVKGPAVERRERLPSELQPVLEMLKMLLRIVASEQGVAGRLIASSDDLEELAKRDDAAIPAMEGWRYEVFGREALNMKHGKTALSLDKGVIVKKPV